MREIQQRSTPRPDRSTGINPFPFLRRGLLALSLSLSLAAWPVAASDDCEVPVEQWQSREAVHQMAAAQGWEVQRLKIDDGCYEVHGKDAQGRAFKARIDPQTLKVMKIKYKDHDRNREREHASQDARSAPADSAAVPRDQFH